MAHVTLIFEDDDTGEIAFRANFTGGEDVHSNAHRMANQVIGFLDEHAKKKSEEVITPVSAIAAPPEKRIIQ